jgi:hypothetical protein
MHVHFDSLRADFRNAGKAFCPLLLAGLLAGATRVATAQPPSDPVSATALGAHTLLVQTEGKGSSPASTVPVNTQPSGSSLLVLVAGYSNNPGSPTDSYANQWTQVGPPAVYNGYDGRFNARAYVSLTAKGGRDDVVSVSKSGTPAGEITVPFVEIEHAGTLQDVAQNYPVPGVVRRLVNKLARTWQGDGKAASSADLTSDTVTTTGPATLVAVWWGDATVYRMTAVPDNGFRVIERFLQLPPNSGVQCAVAVKQVAAAGTYNVTWKGTPAQGAILWLFAFQAGRRQH